MWNELLHRFQMMFVKCHIKIEGKQNTEIEYNCI
jgi:hypothetical protein